MSNPTARDMCTHSPSKKADYSESQLVFLLKSRIEKGYSYLYSNYSGALYTTILNIVADRHLAADTLQDCFVNIYRNIDSYDPHRARLFTWMNRIAQNLSIDLLRSKGYRANAKKTDIDVLASGTSFQPNTTQYTDHIGLDKLVGRLKPKYREPITLNFLQGYSKTEIACLLDLPLGTVKTRIAAALTKLRAAV